MALERVHSFLAHPSKNDAEQPSIGGTNVPRVGQLWKMLSDVFDRASSECDIDIVFQPDDEGSQQNKCRDLLVGYVARPTVTNGRRIAERLQTVTTHRSGLGLLFLMKGNGSGTHKLVISRFPADQGVIAEEDQDQLSVQFIERVFMKSAKAYKSALYESDSLDRGFWDGRAVDLQIRGPKELSDYWIRDFLLSDLRTTGPAGTKRLAVALREATRLARAHVKEELIAAASLLRSQHGKRASARQLVDRLGLSQDAAKALEEALPRPDLMNELFEFDRAEFVKHAMYRSVELDNGGLLLAEDERFSEVFDQEVLDPSESRVRFSTEGRIISQRLRKNR